MTNDGKARVKTHCLDDDDIDWIRAYRQRVIEAFTPVLHACRDRFPAGGSLLRRFSDSTDLVVKRGQRDLAMVAEAHNEICVASELARSSPPDGLIEYEPSLNGCATSIDFRVTAKDDRVVYVDVKTIAPRAKDRWDQFARAKEEGWLADRTDVILSQSWPTEILTFDQRLGRDSGYRLLS